MTETRCIDPIYEEYVHNVYVNAEYPLACRLAAEIGRPRVLYLSTLLHDVGKDIGGKGHAERGAELCATICPRLGLPAAETSVVYQSSPKLVQSGLCRLSPGQVTP